jgi:hypothetical protein
MITVRKFLHVYRGDTFINGKRVRLSLGTRNQDAAQRLASRIERALSEGSKSEIWEELKSVLPEYTFQQLSAFIEYVAPQKQPAKPQPLWTELRASFEGYMRKHIALGKLRESTRDRYLQTLKQFEAFLAEQNISRLQDMTKGFILARLAINRA